MSTANPDLFHDAQERLDVIMSVGHDAVWEWDLLEESLHFSGRWLEMHGYGQGDFDARRFNWRKIVHPEDVPEVERLIRAHLDGETTFFENIHRNRHKTGHYIWVHSRGKALRDPAGRLKRVIGIEWDVTEEIRLKNQLELATDRVRALLEYVPEPVLIVDHNGRIQDASRSALDFIGMDRNSLVGTDSNGILRVPSGSAQWLLQEQLKDRRVERLRIVIRTAGDFTREVELICVPLGSQVSGWMLLINEQVSRRI